MNKALLLSGGIDSISIAYWLKPQIGITVNYGQLSFNGEFRASKKIAEILNIQHETIHVDCSHLGSGDLISDVPNFLAPKESTEWWPYRNQLIVTLALMKAINLEVDELYVGSVSSDQFHKDGTKEFYHSLNDLVQMQEGNIKVSAPAITLDTVSLVKTSEIPESVLLWAHSCHKAEYACGNCRGCNKYKQVLSELYGYDF